MTISLFYFIKKLSPFTKCLKKFNLSLSELFYLSKKHKLFSILQTLPAGLLHGLPLSLQSFSWTWDQQHLPPFFPIYVYPFHCSKTWSCCRTLFPTSDNLRSSIEYWIYDPHHEKPSDGLVCFEIWTRYQRARIRLRTYELFYDIIYIILVLFRVIVKFGFSTKC